MSKVSNGIDFEATETDSGVDEIDLGKLAYAVGLFRGKRTLREVAAEIPGVSYATLTRIENGTMPSLNVYIRLCRWMNVDLEKFLRTSTNE